MIALEFAWIFLFILVLGYLLPAGYFYYRYHVRRDESTEQYRIQERRPTARTIRREIQLSLVSILIFSVMATVLFQLYQAGQTGIYWRFGDYPLAWLPVSFFLCLVIHDTYFYWTHRFMHWRRVFKYFHLGHHKSVSPTPWAIYSFQPAEAILQFASIFMIVVFVPLHPLVLLAFLWYDSLVNVAGHTGFEMIPRRLAKSSWFKGFNTVTHHDNHHTNLQVNYGAFFNVWDRWMGTFQDDVAQGGHEQQEPRQIEQAARRLHNATDQDRQGAQFDPQPRQSDGLHRKPPSRGSWNRRRQRFSRTTSSRRR